MDTIGYYPGCSLQGSAFEYDRSVRAVAREAAVALAEVPDWVCCGASSAHAIDREAALSLATDTLAKARGAGLQELLVPCAMCFQRLSAAARELADHPAVARDLAAVFGLPGDSDLSKVRAVNVLDWLTRMLPDKLKALRKHPLKGWKVACYYGCLLVRPPRVTGATEWEAPRQMEAIVRALGGETVRWGRATECCGASFALSRKSVVLRQGLRIWELAREAGANVLCLACPMCQANLDMRQREFLAPGRVPLPVVYLTQLVGLAFGLPASTLGLQGHFVPLGELLPTPDEARPTAADK
ncbi:MAG: heterodisulfide reductase subunit B [Candidatus Riflebacteria bacterium]|nr:heterodisulfide reductase subunit B [Candidatus Riflebacteria bacterium]